MTMQEAGPLYVTRLIQSYTPKGAALRGAVTDAVCAIMDNLTEYAADALAAQVPASALKSYIVNPHVESIVRRFPSADSTTLQRDLSTVVTVALLILKEEHMDRKPIVYAFMPSRIRKESIYVDYPELWYREVRKISRREDMDRLRGIKGGEYIWYAGGPDEPRVCDEFNYIQCGPRPLKEYVKEHEWQG